MRQLPSNYYPGRFHTGGVADQFKLPVAKISGTCSAVVGLIDGAPETQATWLEIGLAATQLNIACVGTGMFSKLKGGFTFVGERGRIRIDLVYSGLNGVGGNGTVDK